MNSFVEKPCPVCGYQIARKVFDAGTKPLATNAWPQTRKEAMEVERFRQVYVQCLDCSHVWNHFFDWENIPYQEKPNKMFNSGAQWGKHLAELNTGLKSRLPKSPVVIDIGCGDGSFLSDLASEYSTQGRFIGFDPCGDVKPTKRPIEFYKSLFLPSEHVNEYEPDLILMRHVVEHLKTPASFLSSMALAASSCEKPIYLYCEVPCIDRVFQTHRLADFYYEHPSQFTTASFRQLLSSIGSLVSIEHGYDREVIYGLVQLGLKPAQMVISANAGSFSGSIKESIKTVRDQVQKFKSKGQKIAIWGGTGKCASFMHHYELNWNEMDLVVDSDQRKVGSFVPGIGKKISSIKDLRDLRDIILIIPTQWRAQDILIEAETNSLNFEKVLIEHQGRLIDFLKDSHPYDKSKLSVIRKMPQIIKFKPSKKFDTSDLNIDYKNPNKVSQTLAI